MSWEIVPGQKKRNQRRPRPQPAPYVEPAKTLPIVKFQRTPCPNCKSKNNRVYGANKPFRYHICHDCGAKFQSIEED